jgi:hypothetical protein
MLEGAPLVLVVPDCDGTDDKPKGRQHARGVCASLHGRGVPVKLVELAPERQDGFDVSNFVELHAADAREAVESAARRAPFWHPGAGKQRAIVVRSLAEALREVPDEPDWLLSGYLARGWITLLAGAPKGGKTTMLCGILDAFERGKPFLGFATRPTGVLVLTEQSPSVFKETVRNFALRIGPNVEAMFHREQPLTLGWAERAGEAIDLCLENRHGLLVVDTYSRWAQLQQDHNAAEILDSMMPLLRAAQEGLAVLIVHHTRKAGGTHRAEVSGRVEIPASVDIILSLSRVGDARKLAADGRSMRTPAEVTFRAGPDGFARV